MNKLTEPATPATQKLPHEELYFQLMETDNLLQAARNRISEAAVKLFDLAESDVRLAHLGPYADDVLQSLTAVANKVRDEANRQRYRAQVARIPKGGAS